MEDQDPEESADVARMHAACIAQGFKLTVGEVRHAWQKHSDDWHAGWLYPPEDINAAVNFIRRWHKRDR